MINHNSKIYFDQIKEHCKNRNYYGNLIYNFFIKNKYRIVTKASLADVVIIVTCAFNELRENYYLKRIEMFRKMDLGNKKIIVSYCLPKISSSFKKSRNMEVVGPYELNKFNKLFEHNLSIKKTFFEPYAIINLSTEKQNNECVVQICQGCRNNCSYCTIKKAKGDVKSKNIIEIVEEIKQGIKNKQKTFHLIGDDCGSYGLDKDTNIAQLFNKINDLNGNFKFHIYNFNPMGLLSSFDKMNTEIFKKISVIVLPIQSFNQRILNIMNRKYEIEKVMDIVKNIKLISPSVYMVTHIIYGFPTETRKEFEYNLTNDYLNNFDMIVPLLYSDRLDTLAIKLKGKINKEEKNYRLCRVLELAKNNSKIGPIKDILMEKKEYFKNEK